MKPDEPIMIDPSHKGRLHKALGIPEGQPIPLDKLHAASTSLDPEVRKMAQFALNSRKFKKPL